MPTAPRTAPSAPQASTPPGTGTARPPAMSDSAFMKPDIAVPPRELAARQAQREAP